MKTSCGKFLNLAHYFPYDVKLRLLAQSRSFLDNQKARNTIVGAENLLRYYSLVDLICKESVFSLHDKCTGNSSLTASNDKANDLLTVLINSAKFRELSW